MQFRKARPGLTTAVLVLATMAMAIALWVITDPRVALTSSQRLPARSRQRSDWSTVDMQQFDDGLFVSAAYLDARAMPPDVKVMAYFLKGRGPDEELTCHYESNVKVKATFESARPLGPKTDTNAWLFGYIRCVTNVSTSMKIVTLSSRNGSVVLSLPIRPSMGAVSTSSLQKRQPPRGLFLCTKSLYGSVDAFRLVEWIELHLLLGIRHIYVYSYGINAEAVRALEHYELLGVVTLVHDNTLSQMVRAQPLFENLFAQRNFEYATGVEPFIQLQELPLHDCLFRYGADYEYMVVCDTDEVLVPRIVRTLPELAAFLRGVSPKATSFTLHSAPYLSAYEAAVNGTMPAVLTTPGSLNDDSANGGGGSNDGERLHMLRYTRHGEVREEHHKSFHSTSDTLFVDQHTRKRPLDLHAQVAGDVAWVHHYRDSCKHSWCHPGVRVIDDGVDLMGRYADELRHKVRVAASELGIWSTRP